ncbi:MAG: FAD-dependent oxidoreductase [Austwickia sp.]|jgi:phytoene dehydrogenase-like protein|nr:MAG: FAD-dependent oxidoreductase [Austwickia sp.]
MSTVVVVGAGLAGLRCAARLAELGHDPVVLEAADEVGGRLRTDRIDGYLCDHGFAVINPAYPALRRWVDVTALDLQPFRAGLLVRTDAAADLAVLADPRREPGLLPATLRSGYLDPRELSALARWAAPVLGPVRRLLGGPDQPLAESFDAAGLTGRLRHEVLDTFLAGVLVDSHGTTSATFTRLLVRMFVLGSPGLPSRGIDTLPRLMAAALPTPVRTGEPVEQVSRAGAGVVVRTPSASYEAAAVVLATAPAALPPLLAGLEGSPAGRPAGASGLGDLRPMHGLVTWWFATDEPPHRLAMLAVDGRRGPGRLLPGPVWNAADVTAAAPTYAPAGRHLVQATTLLDRPDVPAGEADVRRHLAEIYGRDTAGWEVVARHEIRDALPAMPPPLRPRLELAISPGVFVCGDHRDTASIQGALVSGQRAADAVATARTGAPAGSTPN